MTYRYKSRPLILLSLRLLEGVDEEDTYPNILRTLGRAVQDAGRRIASAESGGNAGAIEIVTDIETQAVELLLGTAYVLCQAWITAVTQAALNVRRRASNDGLNFRVFDKDHEVRALGEPFKNTTYSNITVLWELGNYFKHRDEWTRDIWTNPTGRAEHTIDAIRAAGLRPDAFHGNLRIGAEALGNTEYSDMGVFETIIQGWHRKVYDSCVKATAPLHRGYL